METRSDGCQGNLEPCATKVLQIFNKRYVLEFVWDPNRSDATGPNSRQA
jgi:hypothetical protein